MKNTIIKTFLFLAIYSFVSIGNVNAQGDKEKQKSGKKLMKEAEKVRVYGRIDSLVNSRQFVFQAFEGPGSEMVYVIVDSSYAEVQGKGYRQSLQGRITEFDIRKNEKKKTLSVTIKMRDEVYSTDVFIFIGTYGEGQARIKSDALDPFSFNGKAFDFEEADITQGPGFILQ